MSGTHQEGKDGVPLRFPRPVMALIAAGTAAVSIGIAAAPAHADQARRGEWWLSSLGIRGAWAASQGSGVTVAVLSDGVDASQADLAGAVTEAPAPAGAPVQAGQYLGQWGTPIASLIAGRGHGSGGNSGIVGVAPEARILSVPVTLPPGDPELSQTSVATAIPATIAAGIRYAVKHGATVIDLPIDPGQPGSTGTGGESAAAGGSPAEQSAVKYALARDVILVAPAGDDGASTDAANYPAAYPGVIAVGAFNSAFIKAPWSSHLSYVTLTAAGVGMRAAANTGGYQTVSSTTAASAVVSGIAALIRSRYPGLTAGQIRKALISTTVYHPVNGLADGSGYGSVNADRAMAAAAALDTPSGDRAGAGAQPLVAPAAVPAASATRSTGAQLIRAGEISAGLLAVLLLLIAAYAATRRRRRRSRQPAVTTQWAQRQAQSRYPQAAGFPQAPGLAQSGGTDADRMLEIFTAPAAEPGRTGVAQPARLGALSSRDGDGLFGSAAALQANRPPNGRPAAADEPAGPSRQHPHGPASTAVSRRPAVSGAPPWEPASAPNTELPWTAAPGRHAISGAPAGAELPAAQPVPPAAPAWPGVPAGQSLFEPGDRHVAGPAVAGPAVPAAPGTWDPAGENAGIGGPPGPAAPFDWAGGSPAGSGSQPGWSAEEDWPARPRTAASGLPVRQPRPAKPAPLSPSGSLWDPVESEPADGQSDSLDAGSRPIYVWNPVRPSHAHPSAGQSYPAPPAELPDPQGEWSAPE